jgi:hypothetical protein
VFCENKLQLVHVILIAFERPTLSQSRHVVVGSFLFRVKAGQGLTSTSQAKIFSSSARHQRLSLHLERRLGELGASHRRICRRSRWPMAQPSAVPQVSWNRSTTRRVEKRAVVPYAEGSCCCACRWAPFARCSRTIRNTKCALKFMARRPPAAEANR